MLHRCRMIFHYNLSFYAGGLCAARNFLKRIGERFERVEPVPTHYPSPFSPYKSIADLFGLTAEIIHKFYMLQKVASMGRHTKSAPYFNAHCKAKKRRTNLMRRFFAFLFYFSSAGCSAFLTGCSQSFFDSGLSFPKKNSFLSGVLITITGLTWLRTLPCERSISLYAS